VLSDTANGGTEFLMNSLDFFGLGDNRLAVWAIINTCVLASPACAGPLLITAPPRILHVRAYKIRNNFFRQAASGNDDDPVWQRHRQLLRSSEIDVNDDRLGQVVYANGRLYAGLDTQVSVAVVSTRASSISS